MAKRQKLSSPDLQLEESSPGAPEAEGSGGPLPPPDLARIEKRAEAEKDRKKQSITVGPSRILDLPPPLPDFQLKNTSSDLQCFNFKSPDLELVSVTDLQLEHMPDEVILKILSFVQIEDILRCGQLSKRIRAISHDESLWIKIYLAWKKVPNKFLELVLNNGCNYLSLSCAKLEGTRLKVNSKSCKLKYLDLTGCESNRAILYCCNLLQKLSLRFLLLNTNLVRKVCAQNGTTLQILDLFKCQGVNFEEIQLIINNCCELKELNLSDTYLSQDSVKFLVKQLTPKVIRG